MSATSQEQLLKEVRWKRRVATIYCYKDVGRSVKKGEKGIRILAPIVGVRRKKDEEADKDITKQNRAVLVGFRSTYVRNL